MDQVTYFFEHLFSTDGFPARWWCGEWSAFHGWLYILSDIAIWAAYTSIPIILVYFVVKSKTRLMFQWVFLLFALFIYACGLTHLIDGIIFWHPIYRLSAVVRFVTALASWATVFALMPLLPKALALRSPIELEREIQQRKAAEDQLRETNENLESLVEERAAQHKLTSDALQLSDDRYRLVIQGSNDGIWDWDVITNEVYWNHRLYDILGLDPLEKFPISYFEELLHPDDRERVMAALLGHVERPDIKYDVEYRIRHSSGSYRYCLARGEALRDAEGNATRMAGLLTDLTDRYEAEKQIATRGRQQKAVADLSQLALSGTGLQTLMVKGVDKVADTLKIEHVKIIEYLPEQEKIRFAAVTGYANELFLSETPLSLAPHYAYALQSDEPVIIENIDTETRFSSLPLYKDYGFVSGINVPILSSEGTPYGILEACARQPQVFTQDQIIFFQTVAHVLASAIERKQVEAQLAVARDQAEEASRNKSQFLANMSHELRTPLNAIIGYSEMMLQNQDLAEDKKVRYVRNISTSGHHLLDTVNDILDVVKIEAGKLVLDIQYIQLAPLIQDLRDIIQIMVEQKNIAITYEIVPIIEGLEADPVRLKQILLNLLSNGIKFNKQGGQLKLCIKKSDDAQWIIFEVSDTGIGLTGNEQAKLFQEFYQADSSYARRQEGAGLGLALTKHLVSLHGGTISVKSQTGEGSIFTFTLPVQHKSLVNYTSIKG